MLTCRIKAVAFDLWQTLLFERNGAELERTAARCNNFTQALNKLGIHVTAELVELAMKK